MGDRSASAGVAAGAAFMSMTTCGWISAVGRKELSGIQLELARMLPTRGMEKWSERAVGGKHHRTVP